MNSLCPTVECKEDHRSYIRNLFNYQKKTPPLWYRCSAFCPLTSLANQPMGSLRTRTYFRSSLLFTWTVRNFPLTGNTFSFAGQPLGNWSFSRFVEKPLADKDEIKNMLWFSFTLVWIIFSFVSSSLIVLHHSQKQRMKVNHKKYLNSLPKLGDKKININLRNRHFLVCCLYISFWPGEDQPSL